MNHGGRESTHFTTVTTSHPDHNDRVWPRLFASSASSSFRFAVLSSALARTTTSSLHRSSQALRSPFVGLRILAFSSAALLFCFRAPTGLEPSVACPGPPKNHLHVIAEEGEEPSHFTQRNYHTESFRCVPTCRVCVIRCDVLVRCCVGADAVNAGGTSAPGLGDVDAVMMPPYRLVAHSSDMPPK